MKNSSATFYVLLFLFLSFNTIQAQLQNPRNTEYQWKTDTTLRNVELSEIILLMTRGGFPAIDYPKFIGKESGMTAFFKHEPVIAVVVNNEAKAYPLNMLTMHEMTNDSLGGLAILPTYCPLCNSSIVYNRTLKHNDKTYNLDFEVSGMLRHSDMIMADKQTETWWQQLSGKGIVGELYEAELEIIPSMVISVEEFFTRYPKGKILSPNTGTSSEDDYGTNPYVGYDNPENTPYKSFYKSDDINDRLPPMERIISVGENELYKIYPFSKLMEEGVINDNFNNNRFVLFYKSETVSILDQAEIAASKNIGSATVFYAELGGNFLNFEIKDNQIIDKNTKSTWDITGLCIKGKLKGKTLRPMIHGNHFAFAWLSFHPDSMIYGE